MVIILVYEEVLQMIRDRIARDISDPFVIDTVQIHVEQPFGADLKVHNEVPGLFVRFRPRPS